MNLNGMTPESHENTFHGRLRLNLFKASYMAQCLSSLKGAKMAVKNVLALAVFVQMISCQSQSALRNETLNNPHDENTPYPVSPRVHAELPTTNPLDPKTFPRTTPIGKAYARYAIGLLSQKSETFSAESNPLLMEDLKAITKDSKISPQTVSRILKTSITSMELKASADQIRQIYPQSELEGNVVTKSLILGKQLNQCMKESGTDINNCCRAFLIPYVLFQSETVPESFSTSTNFSDIDFSKLINPNSDQNENIFNLLGTKVWLSQCSIIALGLPRKVNDFKKVFGDYHTWKSEFHPISMAKQRGRRIYRNSKLKVSIAETLTESCGVEETEFIVEGKDSNLAFGVYNQLGQISPLSNFPKGNGGDALRFSPDICMGCHVKLDSRRFNVRIPSKEALKIHLFQNGDKKLYRNDIACAFEGERIIWDEKPRD